MTEATMRPLKRGHRDDGASDGGDRSVAGLVTSLVFVGWWLLALRIPSLMFLTAGEQLAWAPAMDRIYPAIVAANLLFLASECLRYTPRRHSSLTRRIATAAVLADAVFLFLMITSDYHWVRWQGGSLAGREADIVRLVNVVLTAVMLAVAFGVMRRWLLALARRFTTHPPKAALASGR